MAKKKASAKKTTKKSEAKSEQDHKKSNKSSSTCRNAPQKGSTRNFSIEKLSVNSSSDDTELDEEYFVLDTGAGSNILPYKKN